MNYENVVEGFCWIADGIVMVVSLGNKRSRLTLKWNQYLYKKKYGIF